MKGKIHYFIVILLLILYFLFALSSVLQKSVTYDEVAHLAAGYSHWKFGDFRLVTEHPPLIFLWASLPLLFQDISFPSLNQRAWEISDPWNTGWDFFFGCGNNPRSLLLSGRLMMILLGVGLGFLIYIWSRRLFGKNGAIVSLLLYAFSPTMLAHGRLIATDVPVSLFFLAAAGGFWWVLHRISFKSVILFTLGTLGLFLSKFSAVLFLPMAGVILFVRLIGRRPLIIGGGDGKKIDSLGKQILVFASVLFLQIVVIFAGLWAVHGFRYTSFRAGDLSKARFDFRYKLEDSKTQWDNLLDGGGMIKGMVSRIQERRLLPEAFLYGFLYALRATEERSAFLNGEIRIKGWWYFFPYAFLVKTPLPLFGFLLLAALVSLYPRLFRSPGDPREVTPFKERLYQTTPLWTLFIVYWGFSLTSKLNIGHRHILPSYPVLFILAGAGGVAWESRKKVLRFLLIGLSILFILVSLRIRPHYLANFNLLAGGPKNGYRHLVDSSLDWGQDLPALERFLDKRGPKTRFDIVYLSYFGMGDPNRHRIGSRNLPFHPSRGAVPYFPLTRGLYCISATQLQQVYLIPSTKWTESMEKTYREASGLIERFQEAEKKSPGSNPLVFQTGKRFWEELFEFYHKLRFARLCVMLRRKKPHACAGYSILIYKLTDSEVQKAVHGPPLELVPDPPLMREDPRMRLRSPLARYHLFRGLGLANKGETDQAIQDLQKTLELEPDYPEAKRTLESLLQKRK